MGLTLWFRCREDLITQIIEHGYISDKGSHSLEEFEQGITLSGIPRCPRSDEQNNVDCSGVCHERDIQVSFVVSD